MTGHTVGTEPQGFNMLDQVRCHVANAVHRVSHIIRDDHGLQTVAILPVADVPAAMAWHRRLGFEVEAYDDGYAWVRDEGSEIYHLARHEAHAADGNGAAVYLHVHDADAWHQQFVDEGLAVTPLVNEPWGKREFSLADPDGNRLRLGADLAGVSA